MAKPTTESRSGFGANAPVARRLRLLRAAGGYTTATAFANKLGISVARYLNFEGGKPLSIEVAMKIVQAIPGCSLDWLYNGERRGLSFGLNERLSAAEEDAAKANTGRVSGRAS
jgi:transcriptional regulator with XRE-family HTH domain